MKCELCESAGGTLIWRDERCRVVRIDEAGYPGYCRAIWGAHVAEMTDLSDDDRAHFMRVVFALEAALRELLRPHKVNLASLGNLTPHLHWHVIPRFADDPHFPNPVWSVAIRQPASRAQISAAFDKALAERLSRI